MNLVAARKFKKDGSASGIERIQLAWKNEDGKEIVGDYALLRGSVIFPQSSFPGIVLLAGQKFDSEKIIILEERIFPGISAAVDVFVDLWRFSPTLYYFKDSPESEGFVNFLRKAEALRVKIPLVPALHADSLDYGLQLIRDYLDADKLVVPPDSVLATQLKEGRHDTPIEELYAASALRYLLAGIQEFPWESEVFEINLDQCLV